jgi:biopolymer transport protein ExbD
MGRAKIKKKSTFIDMTAMSDVTVLLLTFFMLTSTFVKKEPVQVTTPASVSEIKIPEKNILQILVDPNGKIFMSMDKQSDLKAWDRNMVSHLLRNRKRNSCWPLLSECR